MNDVWHEHCSSIAASGGDHESPQVTRPAVHVVTAHNTRIQMVRTMQAANKGREKTQTASATSVSTWVLLFIPVVLSSRCWHAKQLNIGGVSNALQSVLSSNSLYQRGQHGQGSDCKHGGQCSTGQNSIRECPAAQQMIDWIRSHGGVVNVDVREVPGQGRMTVAPVNFKAGDVFAVIPRKVCFHGHPDNEWVSAALFAAELRNHTASKFRPFLAALPERSQVWSYYDLPLSYIPLIQSTVLEGATLQLQEGFMAWHQQQGDADTDAHVSRLLANMTHDKLRYSMSLIKTRMFGSQFGQLMVPLIDMANHHNSCKHTITTYPNCGAGLEEGCLVWSAGETVAAGYEVCNIYHADMLQDRAILQYGFLQDGDPAHELSSIDRFDYNTNTPWSFEASLEPFYKLKNSSSDLSREITRLSDLLSRMKAVDSDQQGIAADAHRDPEGQKLQQMFIWRQQRRAAISRELQRLNEMLQYAG